MTESTLYLFHTLYITVTQRVEFYSFHLLAGVMTELLRHCPRVVVDARGCYGVKVGCVVEAEGSSGAPTER